MSDISPQKSGQKKYQYILSRFFTYQNCCKFHGTIPEPVWAIGFALEQPLHVVTLACSASRILKRLQHKHVIATLQNVWSKAKFSVNVVRSITIFILALSVILFAGNASANNSESTANNVLPSLRLGWDSEPSEHQIVPIDSIDSLQFEPTSLSVNSNALYNNTTESRAQQRAWTYQFLPVGRIYQGYLAGVNETRLGIVWNKDPDLGMIWDATVGGNAGLFRYGSSDAIFPEGIQIEVEGSSHLRMDLEHERDMDAMDYRFAVPITFGNKIWQLRTGYFHVSSHMGDERMIRLGKDGLPHKRINYVRESILLGLSYRVNPSSRVYFEIDYSTWLGELTKPWHFQFGFEFSSPYPVAKCSYSPFFAVNVQLLEERNYDGNITIQAGLQWRDRMGRLFRVGLQYFRGISEQFEHMYAGRENKFGVGIWYDF